MAEAGSNQGLECNEKTRWKDQEAMDFIKTIATVQSPTEIQRFEQENRNEIIKICKAKGLSIRQLERLTGISFGVLRRI